MKRPTWPATALALVFALSGAEAGDANKEDRQKLQGTWSVTEAQLMGQPLPTLKNAKVVFAGDKVTLSQFEDGRPPAELTCKIDATKKPRQMDLTALKDGKQEVVMQAIYDLQQDTLKIAFIAVGKLPKEKDLRPASFEAPDTATLVLKRQKP
jgi:uncharacterized protein (TIGR03067 family)